MFIYYDLDNEVFMDLHSDNIITTTNDIVRAIDEKRIVGLVLLDLSAAFDTVDHIVLY